MKLRKIVGSFLRMPWIPLLDHITDACEDGAEKYLGVFSILIKPCCKPAIALAWFYGLGEARVATANVVEQIKIAYYKPHQDDIRRWYSQWKNRLILGATSFAVACGTTFYVYPKVISPYVSMSWLIENKDGGVHPSYISTVTKVDSKTGEEKVCTLVSKSIIKCMARQSEVVVWVLGTLLKMPRKRFLPIWFANKIISPIAEGTANNGGNFALWMSLGLGISKLFHLYPSKKERYIGYVGTTTAVLTTSLLLPEEKKIGKSEIVISASIIAMAEVGVRYALFWLKNGTKQLIGSKLEDKEKTDEENQTATGKKLDALSRLWSYITCGDDASLSSSWPEFTYPSQSVWVGLVAGWATIGMALNGN